MIRGLSLSVLLLMSACKKDADEVGTDDTTDSGGELAEFGLTERPANPDCVAPPRPTAPDASVELARVFSSQSFEKAIWLGQAPGDDQYWYVAEQDGEIWRFENVASPGPAERVLDIRPQVNDNGSELGLLGVAFAPDWQNNGRVFLHYNAGNIDSVLARIDTSSGGASWDVGSLTELARIDQPYSNHNGGSIEFGPDGMLYWALGDGGSAGDPGDRAQNLNNPLGKIHRVDVSTGQITTPPDNPFVGADAIDTIYAYGLRNVFRMSFDPLTGELWAGDVGQDAREEVDLIRAGGNYGWRVKEGNRCYESSPCEGGGLIDPVIDYRHAMGVSVMGGQVYRGTEIPALYGVYVFGDFYENALYGIVEDATTGEPTHVTLGNGRSQVAHYAVGHDGEVYGVGYNSGVFKLQSLGGGGESGFPQTLSETGCFDASAPGTPASGVLPYTLNHKFWSDGADKERFFAIPDGSTIGVLADGDLELPIGSVTMKTFHFEGHRVETRLFVRHDDGDWAGYSYAWREDQSDADLVATTEVVSHPSGEWAIPSRGTCTRCHTEAANRSLGLELPQLDTELTYPSTGLRANQVATLMHIGVIDGSESWPEALPGRSDTEAPLDKRARAYLHANCASCHQPDGQGGSQMDLRWTATDLGLCAAPEHGDLGIAGAQLLVPGDAARSLLVQRTADAGAYRMPPIASHVVDSDGVELLEQWVNSLTDCP